MSSPLVCPAHTSQVAGEKAKDCKRGGGGAVPLGKLLGISQEGVRPPPTAAE